MLLVLAYVLFVAGVLFALAARRLAFPNPRDNGPRILGLLISLPISAVGITALGDLGGEPDHSLSTTTLAHLAFGALAVGAVLSSTGSIVWQGSLAFALRLSGWLLMATALVVPSQLTLILPLLAIPVGALRRVPAERHGRTRPQLSS